VYAHELTVTAVRAVAALTHVLHQQEIAARAIEDKEDEEEDDLVDNSWEKNLPKSFGGQSEIYGEKLGQVDHHKI
jgi:hypothetical protein